MNAASAVTLKMQLLGLGLSLMDRVTGVTIVVRSNRLRLDVETSAARTLQKQQFGWILAFWCMLCRCISFGGFQSQTNNTARPQLSESVTFGFNHSERSSR